MNLREALLVRIHVPVSPETFRAMLAGDVAAGERDPVLAAILAVVRADNPLGDFGLYKGVAEIGLGWESFQPGPDARPALGEAAMTSLSPTVILSLHAPCSEEDPEFLEAMDRIMAAHPWEIPVIEIAPTWLAERGQ
ncbi:hypothetical protein [Novosphingobium sp. PhB55]|uniref:hypothetical protein n=1 Tax=unclassified Novosphingobium TaxID=2644732 RepID=UPI001064FCE1|nr:hypothetical protein [Novosphingobium sp. PhB55]TDW64052.1 hypothetical protein EDF57_105529 [Novosphingobium sp. PhB55]